MNPDSVRRVNRGAWIIGAVLGATVALLVVIAVGVVRQSARRPVGDGLDYQRLLGAVDELLALDGSRAVLRFDVADTTFGRQRRRYDTLVIEDAASTIPSLSPGGFLNDEVRRYNKFQRERLAVAARDASRFHQLQPYNPSIFRPVRRGGGGWYGEVRTRDASFGWGLHSPHGSLSFERPRRITRRVDGRTQVCEFEPHENDALPAGRHSGWTDIGCARETRCGWKREACFASPRWSRWCLENTWRVCSPVVSGSTAGCDGART